MSAEFRMEPSVCARCARGDVYQLRDWPTDPQKLINKVKSLDDEWDRTKITFIEAYDARGMLHLINTKYILEIYIDERAYLKKEEPR